MIRQAHDDDRTEPSLLAPVGKDSPLVLGSADRPGDLLGHLDTQRVQLSDGPRGSGLVMNPSADELTVHGTGLVGEHRHPRGHALVNKVSGFEHARAVGINRHNDDVGGRGGRTRDHEGAPGSSQHR